MTAAPPTDPDPRQGKHLVLRVEDGMDRQDVYATVYQMRNFYHQLHDGFFTDLDVFNYIQHHQIALWCRKGDAVLDVCCGRGLMLPLLRYHSKDIARYVGVDIEPRNAKWRTQRVTDKKPVDPQDYYPFPTHFVHADAAAMAGPLRHQGLAPFNVVIYTSAIEHMHPDVGRATLAQCRAVAAPGARLIVTTPNRPPERDGYATKYRAHVYEWSRAELEDGLTATGWRVVTTWGLSIGKRDLKRAAEPLGLLPLVERLERFLPREWLGPALAPMFPQDAHEVAMLAVPA